MRLPSTSPRKMTRSEVPLARRLALELGAQGAFANNHQLGVNFGHRPDEILYPLVMDQPADRRELPSSRNARRSSRTAADQQRVVELLGVNPEWDQMASVGVLGEYRRTAT